MQDQILELNEDEMPIVDFGVSNPNEEFVKKYKVKNFRPNMIEVKPWSNDPDLNITVTPNPINAESFFEMKFTYTPKENRDTPLDTEWGCEVIVG